MRRLVAGVAIAVGFLAMGWATVSLLRSAGEEEPAVLRQSRILAEWPDQPAWFAARSAMPLCGEERVVAHREGNDEDAILAQRDTAGRECLYRAYRAGTEAEFVERIDTFEGPFLTVYRVQPLGVLEIVMHDTRRGAGAEGWRAMECSRVGPVLDIARENDIAGVTEKFARAMVFLHDIRSCKEPRLRE